MQTAEMCQNMATLRNKLFFQHGIDAKIVNHPLSGTHFQCFSGKKKTAIIDAIDTQMYSVALSAHGPHDFALALSNGIDNTVALVAMFFASN